MRVHNNQGKPKLLIIGIDGATFTIIDPLIEAGKLPNLDRLIESGSKIKLVSTVHPMSPQAWTSFHTGVNPWKHGILDFFTLDITRPYTPNTWNDIRAVSMVELLDRAGIRTIWNNLLVTYPYPKLRNGIIAGGRMAPRRSLIYPDHLQRDVESLFPGGYEVHIDLSSVAKNGKVSETALLSKLLVHTEHQSRLTEYLMRTRPWDLCFVMFDATDIGQHVFWRYLDDKHPHYETSAPDLLRNAIATLFQEADKFIGRLLEAAPKDTYVLVLSDHGFTPLYATVNLNGFLARAGYTRPMRRYHPRRALRGISARIQPNVRRSRPTYKNLNIIWKKTSAYAHGYMGNIFVNLKGREPEGCVHPQDYEKTLRKVIGDLYRWRNPETGEPMVRAVHRSPISMTQQHCLRGMPDLVIEWFDYRYAGIHPGSFNSDFESGSPCYSHNIPRSADHSLEGILICAGPHFGSSSSKTESCRVSIFDVTPIIMKIMGLSLPDHFDGTVPKELLRLEGGEIESQPERLQGPDASFAIDEENYCSDELSEIADRLRGLGYLE
jgi:predicted AlkP superfamily phosphohydrolase/phosphomutase